MYRYIEHWHPFFTDTRIKWYKTQLGHKINVIIDSKQKTKQSKNKIEIENLLVHANKNKQILNVGAINIIKNPILLSTQYDSINHESAYFINLFYLKNCIFDVSPDYYLVLKIWILDGGSKAAI